jgi:hypothetical protein
MKKTSLKRAATWTGVIVLMVAAYVASPPFIAYWSSRHAPAALPVLHTLWAPLDLYARHPHWPGSTQYVEYEMWATRRLQDHFALEIEAKLNEQTQCIFAGTPLSDVVSYLSAVHDHPMDLLDGVDEDVPLTMNMTGTLRDVLDQVSQLTGLAAAPLGKRIVIGPAAEVERLVAEAEAATSSGRWIADLVVLGNLALIVTVIVLLWRRRAARRAASHASRPGLAE